MTRFLSILILGACFFAPALWAQVPGAVTCRDLRMAPGETAQLQCTVHGGDDIGYTYRWDSEEVHHLRLLSNPAVYAPLFSAPAQMKAPLRIVYTLFVETPKGLLWGQAPLYVEVRPTCVLPDGCERQPSIPEHRPPQVHCPATLHLYELEMASIACQATDPVTGTSASLHYMWRVAGGGMSVSPRDVSNPTVVAPPIPIGAGPRSFPLTLIVTSRRSQLTAHAEVAVVVEARNPYLECPADVSVEAGASAVLACQGVNLQGGGATYAWTGLWGTSTDPLSATAGAAPTFTAPLVSRDTTFHYVVRMQSSASSARHRVSVHIRGMPLASGLESCEALYLFEQERKPLPCHLPVGHHFRWRGPTGPQAPHISQRTITAPPVDADTVFTYYLEVCPDHGGACTAGTPWVVTVLNRRPPALTCPKAHDTYAGEADLLLHCAVSGGTSYTYAWTGSDTDRLSAVDVLSPTFDVPSQVADDQRFAYTVTVTDAFIGTASTGVQVLVRKRGAVELECDQLEYFVYAGSADLPLQPQCSIAGAPEPQATYMHRWQARSAVEDAAQLSATNVRNPIFAVPDTLTASYTYQYTYTVGARYADPASVEVSVTVAPFPAAFDMTVRTVAVHFGDQSVGQQVTLDPMTRRISDKVRGAHSVGHMIFASDQAVDADVELSGGMLYHQDGAAVLPLEPQWSLSVSCLAPASEALQSTYAVVVLRAEAGGCMVLHFGGTLDLRQAVPGPYAGNLDVVVRSGDVHDTYFVPVYASVVAPQRLVTTGPQGTVIGSAEEQRMTDIQNFSIHPHRVILTSERPYGAFTLSNPSVITQEISVQPVFGFVEALADRSGETVVLAPTEAVGDLGAVLLFYPKVFTLGPGQTQYVHYALREDVPLPKTAYATSLEFSSRPRRYVRTDRLPLPDDSLRVAHVTLRIQSAYLPDQGATQIEATLLSADRGLLLLETADGPYDGEIVATDSAGNELGRRQLLLLTSRILQWSLEPQPAGDIMLQFVTQQGSAPPPVTVQWE